MRRTLNVRCAAAGVRPRLPPRGGHPILADTGGVGKEEPRERGVEDRDVVQRTAENGPEGVPDGALVGEIHDLERASGVVQLARPNPETVMTAKGLAECGEILRQARERVHQRRGTETEPNPKSLSRLSPPDARLAATSRRMGSRAT
jgi:hypothetical protein